MAKKAAQVSEALNEDVELSAEEQAALDAEGKEAAAAPAEGEQPEGQQPEEKKHEKYVPYERFETAIRDRDAALQKANEAAEYREKWGRLEERTKLAKEASEQATKAEEQARIARERPDPEIDPVGARAWDAEQRAIKAEQRVTEIETRFGTMEQQRQVDVQQLEMNQWLGNQVQVGRSTVPDYDARVDFARASRVAQWVDSGWTEQEARLIVANEERAHINKRMQGGLPLVNWVVSMSNQWGYQAQQANGNTANGNGQVRQAAPAQVLPSGNQRLEQIQRGQAMQGLGRVASGEVNAATAWQAMGNDEFKKYIGDMDEDLFIEMSDKNTEQGKAFLRKIASIDQAA